MDEVQTWSEKWHQRFIQMCLDVAKWSNDKSTKCGCVIVGPDREIRSTGYNGLPRNVEYTEERDQRPTKYAYYCHAEENAITNAARVGVSLKDCRAYISAPPCANCARMLIQAGVREVFVPEEHAFRDREKDARWNESFQHGQAMMNEAGVTYCVVKNTEHEGTIVITDSDGQSTVLKVPMKVTPGPTQPYNPQD